MINTSISWQVKPCHNSPFSKPTTCLGLCSQHRFYRTERFVRTYIYLGSLSQLFVLASKLREELPKLNFLSASLRLNPRARCISLVVKYKNKLASFSFQLPTNLLSARTFPNLLLESSLPCSCGIDETRGGYSTFFPCNFCSSFQTTNVWNPLGHIFLVRHVLQLLTLFQFIPFPILMY